MTSSYWFTQRNDIRVHQQAQNDYYAREQRREKAYRDEDYLVKIGELAIRAAKEKKEYEKNLLAIDMAKMEDEMERKKEWIRNLEFQSQFLNTLVLCVPTLYPAFAQLEECEDLYPVILEKLNAKDLLKVRLLNKGFYLRTSKYFAKEIKKINLYLF